MRVVNTYIPCPYIPCPGQQVRIVNKYDMDDYQTYSLVTHITEEVDHDGNRYIVLHHEGFETSTFNMAKWEVAISTFVPLW